MIGWGRPSVIRLMRASRDIRIKEPKRAKYSRLRSHISVNPKDRQWRKRETYQ
jgi:hypothetical protein